jgi:phosphotransferase system  glucose/maltose/N-acetylglucosamine-specific IIC component
VWNEGIHLLKINGVLCDLGLHLYMLTSTRQGMWFSAGILTGYLPNLNWTHHTCANRWVQTFSLTYCSPIAPFSHIHNQSDTSSHEDSKTTHNCMHTVTVTFSNPALFLPLCVRWAMTSSDASAIVLMVGILLITPTPLLYQITQSSDPWHNAPARHDSELTPSCSLSRRFIRLLPSFRRCSTCGPHTR